YFSNNFSYTSPQEIIDQYDASDKTFLTDNSLPNVLDLSVNSHGLQVGIPSSLSSTDLYINRDLLKEAGLSEEGHKTWEEVDYSARTVQEKTGKYGFYMQEPADFWAQQGLIESNNTSMLTKTADGKIQASFASPEGIQAMQMVADLIKDGAALHVSWDEGCQSFIDGNCAMLRSGKYGFYMQEPADFWAQQGLIESNNTSMLTKTADGKIQASFASPEGIQAMQMVADLIKDGAALHVSWDEGCQSFIDGNCAML